MTSSGGSPADAGELAEEAWPAATEVEPDSPHEPQRATDRGRASRDLTRTLTATTRLPGPGGAFIADVPNRILALIIDVLVLSVVGFALSWLLGGLVEPLGAIDVGGGELDMAALLVVLAIQLVFSFGYFVGAWSVWQATPGMRLLGLRVGDEADGRPLGWRAASVRWGLLGIAAVLTSTVVYVPDVLGLLLAAMGAAWLLLLLYTTAQRPTRQGLHDRVAHTVVLRARSRASAPLSR